MAGQRKSGQKKIIGFPKGSLRNFFSPSLALVLPYPLTHRYNKLLSTLNNQNPMENLKMLETFNKLKETIGEEATTEVVILFDLKLNEMKEHLATKEDLERTKSQLILWIAGLLASATVLNQLLNYFM